MKKKDFKMGMEKLQEIFLKDEKITDDIYRIAPVWPVAGNGTLIITPEGLVVVDTGIAAEGPDRVRRIREKTNLPFHTIIYTHGHGDHAGGVEAFLEDAKKRGDPPPRIIGQALLPARFDKYQMLAGRRAYIGRLQFPGRPTVPNAEKKPKPGPFVYPTTLYNDSMKFNLGGLTFELYHEYGETDDATWVWIPERKTAVLGDLLIGGCPNTGNPLKEQRYTLEWSQALEKIAGKNPEYVVIAAGPVLEKELAQEVLLDTAKYLRLIQDQVVKLLNEEYWIDDIIKKVKIPAELAQKPWLRPNYGHPVFIIHDVYRRYTGWYDGNPSELFPADKADIGAEVVALAGGAAKLVKRAKELKQQQQSQLALHIIDFVIHGSKTKSVLKEALALKAEILNARADIEPSLIARHILRTGAEIVKNAAEK